MKKFFEEHPGTPPLGVVGDYRCSVHYGNEYRLNEAKKQYDLPVVGIEEIISLTCGFLNQIGIKIDDDWNIIVDNPSSIDYQLIKKDNQLESEKDIIWMKFTRSGHLGVVATSNDVNFDIPNDSADYDKKVWKYNSYYKKQEKVWKHTTSGILVHQIGETWDTSFVLVFPLHDIPREYRRGDIERAVGNYLIFNNVPIIDFYSHNY